MEDTVAPRIFGFSDVAKSGLLGEEADALLEAALLRINGGPFSASAAYLHGRGLVGSLGAEFTGQTVARLFRNPAIAGLKREPDGSLVDAGHPRILTPEQFAQLEERDAEDAKKKSSDSGGEATDAYEYVYGSSDLVVCGLCGAYFHGLRTNSGHPGYCCSAAPRADRPGTCGRVRISAQLLEDHLGEQLVARLSLPATQRDLEDAREDARTLAAELRKELDDLNAGVDSLAGMVLRHEITASSAKSAKTDAKRQQKELARRIRVLERAAATPVTGSVPELVAWWNSASVEAKAGLAQLMLYRVDVFPGGQGVRTLKPGRVKLWWRNQPPPPPAGEPQE
ncbi:hypothetical protein GCM10009759_04420 [Kitasatospora saccharophila]|uniref:Recombinase-like zinc beta ribbon protein n=1 Tax=Kitasatospora saccharophila TaxID=407973 RepID=A0ABN2W7T6_9ACTN